jgi:hypothetical protein
MPGSLVTFFKNIWGPKDSGPFKAKEGGRENRRHTRYRSFARVKFPDHLGEESLLRDISVTGCCVECTSLLNIQNNTPYIMEVIPEASAKIGKFNLEVQSVWIHPGGYSSEVGFSIVASPKGKPFQRYVDYLSWRETHLDKVKAN